ncbi:MAG: GHKL domain-containing protein [Eubacteriales bacterium]|nr:GHKL domain-containing protein [Eubacteriales bacterium]
MTILFLTTGAPYQKYNTPAIIFWILYTVFIFYITVKSSFCEILFIVLVALNLYADIMTIAKLAVSLEDWNLPLHMARTVTSACLLILYIPLIWILMFRLYKKVIEFQTDFSAWKYIWLIPALTYLIFYVKIINDYWEDPIYVTASDLVFSILWSFSSYVFFCIALLLLIQTYQKITAEEQTRMVLSHLKMQEEQYQQLLDNIAETTRIRHDWRHHLLTIYGLAKEQKLEELTKYTADLMPVYLAEEDAPVCQNHVINIILQHYRAMAKAEGITITIKADLPRSLSLSDIDLCIVFGNLAENAIEACISQNGVYKLINITAAMKDDLLVLMIKNTYGNKILVKDRVYYSTKHEGAGVGLLSVRHVVEKNKGHMQVKHDSEYFSVNIILHTN